MSSATSMPARADKNRLPGRQRQPGQPACARLRPGWRRNAAQLQRQGRGRFKGRQQAQSVQPAPAAGRRRNVRNHMARSVRPGGGRVRRRPSPRGDFLQRVGALGQLHWVDLLIEQAWPPRPLADRRPAPAHARRQSASAHHGWGLCRAPPRPRPMCSTASAVRPSARSARDSARLASLCRSVVFQLAGQRQGQPRAALGRRQLAQLHQAIGALPGHLAQHVLKAGIGQTASASSSVAQAAAVLASQGLAWPRLARHCASSGAASAWRAFSAARRSTAEWRRRSGRGCAPACPGCCA